MLAQSINNKVEAYILSNTQHHKKAIGQFIQRVNHDNQQHRQKYRLITELQHELDSAQQEIQQLAAKEKERTIQVEEKNKENQDLKFTLRRSENEKSNF